MKVKISTSVDEEVLIDDEIYLRFNKNSWFKLYGESFEAVFFYCTELEEIYQKYVKNKEDKELINLIKNSYKTLRVVGSTY